MGDTKFTPGPWRLIGGINGNKLFVRIFAPDPSPDSNRELQIIGTEDYHPVKEHNKRRLADMKLIAAAPELYEALKLIVENASNATEPHEYYLHQIALDQAKAALSRATDNTVK